MLGQPTHRLCICIEHKAFPVTQSPETNIVRWQRTADRQRGAGIKQHRSSAAKGQAEEAWPKRPLNHGWEAGKNTVALAVDGSVSTQSIADSGNTDLGSGFQDTRTA